MTVSKEEKIYLEAKASELIYRVYCLSLIQESYIVDSIQMLANVGSYEFEVKKEVKTAKKAIENMRSSVYKRTNKDILKTEYVGEESDIIKKIIDSFFDKLLEEHGTIK